jgi:LPPG:FO 2-phospho-L-lactate transferase
VGFKGDMTKKIVALAGGVGGAKLSDGIARSNSSYDLTVIVNTGDDFTHFGLYITPDLDTVCYNLADMEDQETGWGRRDDSWDSHDEICRLGGPDWFRLGNKDLATHLERTRRLNIGERLSEITADFCRKWGLFTCVIPMTDDQVPTFVETDQGLLPFQDYFVRLGCQPRVSGFEYRGAKEAEPAPGVIEAIKNADLIVICPSNPWVSINPIISIPGIKETLQPKRVLAVSPIIGGDAVKGPAAKMYSEMGIKPSSAAVADHYGDLLDGYVVDQLDQGLIPEIERNGSGRIKCLCTGTLMKTREDRIRVADEVVNFGLAI